ncbi:MAG TPA: glycosyltransferase [Candidatus Acidoferrales bacterium]|jgi:GT2 family glycosyltransferase|nr:glycosyltransferase [Candidatus Acidoferrales bacterium]
MEQKTEKHATVSAPWASVVMPVRKCRATVARSLDALLRQKIPARCEIIFVCDQPDDDSLEVIRNHPLSAKWDFIEIFHPGRGLAQAYNLGWKAARSPHIFNMHSDCYPVDDDAMVRLVDWLEREGAQAVEPLNDIPQGDWEAMSFWDRVTSSQFRHAKPAHALMGKFDLIRRDALEKVGGFDEQRFFSSGEDADMIELIWAIGKIALSDVVVIHAHQHPPNAAFKSALRKHIQQGEGSGAFFRKYWLSLRFLKRAWLIIGVNGLKLVLLIGLFIPPVTLYAAVGMLLLSVYYACWAMLTRDWRVVLIPFAVSLMFACFAVAMVWAFIRGRQSFDYIKAK